MKQKINPINERIARYRKLAGYTQQTAADALKIKKNTYARMELHGNPTPDMLKKLAALYRVSPYLILYGVDGGQTEVIRNPEPQLPRLEDDNRPTFVHEPDLVLTTNEKTCIKVWRQLSKKNKDKVMALMNELYKENNG